jgi:flavorubredoxin
MTLSLTIDRDSGTRVDEVADGVFRISTPVPPAAMPGGFSFNQYLLLDDQPLLFHTGPRRTFPLVARAIAAVMPIERLRWVAFSHVEADECGALNQLLAAAPHALPLCGELAAMVQMNDLADRPPRLLRDDEEIAIGARRLRWLYTPHLPHGWECGYLYETTSRTLLCGDLFAQPGHDTPPLTDGDILGPSEAMRRVMDPFAHGPDQNAHLERLAALAPRTLCCMHGSAWQGDGAALLRAQAQALRPVRTQVSSTAG